MTLTPPLKFFGGKHYLAKWIQGLAPPHYTHRVHPFAGGLGEFWAWPHQNMSEVVNDIDKGLTNFYMVLQFPHLFEEFARHVQAIPFSKPAWKTANGITNTFGYNGDIPDEGRIMRAVAFFVNCRQSMCGGGKTFAPLSKNRTRGGMNEQANAWWSAVDGLELVHNRLKRVVILCENAIEVIKREDSPNTLFYNDPPYLFPDGKPNNLYEHGISLEEHKEFLDVITQVKGKAMISNYSNPLYDDKLRSWTRHERVIDNKMQTSTKKKKMVEVVWTNY